MKKVNIFVFILIAALTSSCTSKKKLVQAQSELANANQEIATLGEKLSDTSLELEDCLKEKETLNTNIVKAETIKKEQINELEAQIKDLKKQNDVQFSTVTDLIKLSKSANENIKATLSQLETKDQYIARLQSAKSKTDSINLAIAVNLKSALSEGLSDEDIEINVDKTVVFVNIADKMLFRSGSSKINKASEEVLGKIAKILASRPDLEVMIEGYTDDKSIRTNCVKDNWDLSVKRATSVVRLLQENYAINPDRLIAAGRGQYDSIVPNDTKENRAKNRRTRIILLPKLNQFYDLLDPNNVSK